MNGLRLTFSAQKDIDGKLVFGVFTPRQRLEYGVIYMDADANPDAPTAPFTRPPYMPIG